MSFELDEEHTAGYIATIKLKDYFDFVTKDKKVREIILESNIRHYQGDVTVNKGIIETFTNYISINLIDDKHLNLKPKSIRINEFVY